MRNANLAGHRGPFEAWWGVVILAGPIARPTFQPVALGVFPAEETTTVRSRVPASVAVEWCRRPCWKPLSNR